MSMKEHSIGGIPIIDREGYLKGIVTNRDLRFEKESARPITEIMTLKGWSPLLKGLLYSKQK